MHMAYFPIVPVAGSLTYTVSICSFFFLGGDKKLSSVDVDHSITCQICQTPIPCSITGTEPQLQMYILMPTFANALGQGDPSFAYSVAKHELWVIADYHYRLWCLSVLGHSSQHPDKGQCHMNSTHMNTTASAPMVCFFVVQVGTCPLPSRNSRYAQREFGSYEIPTPLADSNSMAGKKRQD